MKNRIVIEIFKDEPGRDALTLWSADLSVNVVIIDHREEEKFKTPGDPVIPDHWKLPRDWKDLVPDMDEQYFS